eukprot:XP_001696505.1 predicted protein [Chlamydomonas reinhardtii]
MRQSIPAAAPSAGTRALRSTVLPVHQHAPAKARSAVRTHALTPESADVLQAALSVQSLAAWVGERFAGLEMIDAATSASLTSALDQLREAEANGIGGYSLGQVSLVAALSMMAIAASTPAEGYTGRRSYVKVAQALSTRVDLLTPAYFNQIQLLQDRVPPFPCDEAKAEMARAFGGRAPDQVFSALSDKPVAAASLGQVYKATLRPELGGGEVAVKVQRPAVLEQVALDLMLMRRAAVAMKEAAQLDYRREANNAATFAAQMAAAGVSGVTVAPVRRDLSSDCVLVTEWVDGEKLSESGAADVRELCNTLLNAYLIQLLDTGFLHADPHPGNLIRTPDGRICVLDFGLMTEVTPEQRIALVEYIAHLSTRDWGKLAVDLQTLGFIPPEVDTQEAGLVEPLGRVMVQLVGGGGASKVNIDKVMADLEALGESYPITIPPFFALILRAFSVIEGIALRVDPDYAIVGECFPYLARRLLNDDSPRMRAVLRDVLYGGSYVSELLVDELVAAVDALSRDSLSRLLGTLLASGPAAASLRRVQALGPLRSVLLPLPTPVEVLARMAPAVAVTPEDQEALAVVRAILTLSQRRHVLAGAGAARDGRESECSV